MSLLRSAFRQLEERDYPTQRRFTATVGDVQGEVGWQQGMVWRGYPGDSQGDAPRLSAVFACLRLLSEAISTLPLDTFVRSNGSMRPWRPRPDYLSFEAPGLSKIDYLSQVMLSLLTDGNAYVYTPRQGDGTLSTLIPLDPNAVSVTRERTRRGRQIVYRVSGDDRPFDPRTELAHIKGMCMPGALKGMSPIAYAAETIGVGLSAQRFGKKFFDNGAHASVVIEAPGEMERDAAVRARDLWNADHQGVDNANRLGVLTNGARLNKVSVNPNEAQFLETRQFTVPDIARIYGVPPHLIADASNSTSWGSGLAEQNVAFGQFSLRPWTERIEEAHGRLLTVDGLPTVFLKLNMDARLRPSTKDRLEAAEIAVRNDIFTVNEVRKDEGLQPVPWGYGPRAAPAPAGPGAE